jgi:hypothetical protein
VAVEIAFLAAEFLSDMAFINVKQSPALKALLSNSSAAGTVFCFRKKVRIG